MRPVPVVTEDEVETPVCWAGDDVASRVYPQLIARECLTAADVDRVVGRAVLEADDECRARPRPPAVRRLDQEILVIKELAGLPECLVLLVLEGDVDGAVRPDCRHRELVLIALARRTRDLERAEIGVRARDLLRLRPVLAAVVGVRLEDRRPDVRAGGGLELRPR